MSFLNQMVMADQLYQQQQKEREDREFELLKRKHEQEEMERKAYLAPFETKETLAQYEDAANERQGKKNQQLAWMSPYRPSIEVADDGTRKIGAEMPTSLVLENLMAAAGPGFQSDYITPFAKAAPDTIGKATLDVKETPEEAKRRIEAETEHKRALELAGARKANPRPPRATTLKQTPQEKAADAFFKQALDLYKKEFIAKFERAPDDNEWAQLYQKAVAAKNKTFAQPAATTPAHTPATPATKPAPPATAPQSPQSADEAAAEEDLNVFLPPAKTSKSVSAPQRQASWHEALSPNASPTLLDDYLNFYGAPPISPPSRPPAQLASESAPIVPFSPRPASLASAPAVAPARQPAALPAAAPSSAQIGAMGPAPKSGDLESQQREIVARQRIAKAKDDEWVEGYNQLASAAELQLGRALTDDERTYLANAAEVGSISGIADVEFDWANGAFRARGEDQWRPISDALSSVDFAVRDFFANNWLNRKTRDFENYLESKAKR